MARTTIKGPALDPGSVMAVIRITWIIAKRDVTGGLGMDIY